MKQDHFENPLAKRSRILVHVLIISGTLNLALLATFFTFVLKENKGGHFPLPVKEQKIQRVLLSNGEMLSRYFLMSFEELVKELYDETHVEQGYRKCDLALSCLVAFHYFDLERAVPGFPLEKRQFTFINREKEISLPLYPGLSEGSFEAIRTFARTEIWPLTPEGLFQEFCARERSPDSLKEALLMTGEFYALKRKLHALLSDESILELVKLSKWSSLANFTSLQDFLLSCVEKDSQLAAYLLVHLEREFALKYLDNVQMEKLLSLLTEKTPEVEAFVAEVANGLRPENLTKQEVKPPQEKEHLYTVQPGDSLWKISREFDVKVEVLRMLNKIESDHLKPGTTLILPSDRSPSRDH